MTGYHGRAGCGTRSESRHLRTMTLRASERSFVLDDLNAIAATAATEAGALIMKHYGKRTACVRKEDGTPVTEVDREAHEVIAARLAPTGFPLISEEGDLRGSAEEPYWLVDPLDGTSEYLAMTGQFSVNVALVDGGGPTVGVVHAPAAGLIWTSGGIEGHTPVRRGAPPSIALVSGSEDLQAIRNLAQGFGATAVEVMGAARKFAEVASGRALLYLRTVGSSEWDTAAGQAILEARGGAVLARATGKRLLYGKPTRRNEGGFVALGPSLSARIPEYAEMLTEGAR